MSDFASDTLREITQCATAWMRITNLLIIPTGHRVHGKTASVGILREPQLCAPRQNDRTNPSTPVTWSRSLAIMS